MDQDKGDRQHHNTQHNILVSVKESHQHLQTRKWYLLQHYEILDIEKNHKIQLHPVKLQFSCISKAT